MSPIMARAVVEGQRAGFYRFRVKMTGFEGLGLAPLAEVAGLAEPRLCDILDSGRDFKVKWSTKWETESDADYTEDNVISMRFVPEDVAVYRGAGAVAAGSDGTRLSIAPALRSLRE